MVGSQSGPASKSHKSSSSRSSYHRWGNEAAHPTADSGWIDFLCFFLLVCWLMRWHQSRTKNSEDDQSKQRKFPSESTCPPSLDYSFSSVLETVENLKHWSDDQMKILQILVKKFVNEMRNESIIADHIDLVNNISVVAKCQLMKAFWSTSN